MKRFNRSALRGFTIIEMLMSMVILAMLMAAVGLAFHASTATFGPEAGETSLAQCDDLDDFNGASYSPPIDITRSPLADFANFTQQVQVRNVAMSNFNTVVANHSTDLYRVTVTILMNGTAINSATWIRAR
jgi:prepilin-type N-terminal cleavage/methylation domain-containing protein